MYDVIIVGGGPAGLTSAIYARRASKTVLVLEALNCGGQIINTPDIENYPVEHHISGVEFANKLMEQASNLGAEIRYEKAVEVRDLGEEKEVVTQNGSYTGKAVILATGSENRKLGVEDEDKLVGRGVSYCATCDGNFYRNKTVAVVGGGNTALEDALYLSNLAAKVYLIHRRDELRGAKILQEELFAKENVEILYSHTVSEIQGQDQVSGALIKDVKTEEEKILPLDGVFIAVGITPNTELVKDLAACEGGYVIAGEDCATNIPGLYVAGDARKKPLRQVITAVADGANAVTSIGAFLR